MALFQFCNRVLGRRRLNPSNVALRFVRPHTHESALEAYSAKVRFFRLSAVIRAYVGQGLREDLERLENDSVTALIDSLKRRGVSEEILAEALSESTYGK